MVFKKKQTDQFQAVLPPRPVPPPIGRKHKQDLKMTDLRISCILLMKPFVTPAFIVTLRRNSTCFSEPIIFLQMKEWAPRRRALEVYSRVGVLRNDAHFRAEIIYLPSSRECPRGSWPGGFCVYPRVPQECNQVGEGPLQEAPVKQIRRRITSSQAEKPGRALKHRGPLEHC